MKRSALVGQGKTYADLSPVRSAVPVPRNDDKASNVFRAIVNAFRQHGEAIQIGTVAGSYRRQLLIVLLCYVARADGCILDHACCHERVLRQELRALHKGLLVGADFADPLQCGTLRCQQAVGDGENDLSADKATLVDEDIQGLIDHPRNGIFNGKDGIICVMTDKSFHRIQKLGAGDKMCIRSEAKTGRLMPVRARDALKGDLLRA